MSRLDAKTLSALVKLLIFMLVTALAETTFEKCSDGIDNDQNGHADCADFSCSRSKDIAVRQACQESLAVIEADADVRCNDGKDNDGDGFVDCEDWDCSSNPVVITADHCVSMMP